jgi:hypothetical protein
MSHSAGYTVERANREFVIRIRSDLVEEAELTRFLDSLVLESIRRRSQLTEADAAMLAREVKQAVWERVRSSYEGA